jgi:nucleoside-diphosphate-sugar epimerase
MRIALLGATSQIAKDLVLSFSTQSTHTLTLYARRPEAVIKWLAEVGLADSYAVADFTAFSVNEHFDALLNFVGVGNPAQAAAMGASIFDVTLQYDELALNYVRHHPMCRYIFLSSGAAYGSNFEAPVDENSKAVIPINNLQPQDWYGVAKLHAECRHRALPQLPIIDIRVFNYFSHTQDMSARFLITDILRAIRDKTMLMTSGDYIVRDYIHPSDFYQLVATFLKGSCENRAVDCYSLAPIDNWSLFKFIEKDFGLQYETGTINRFLNATGKKTNYYSKKSIASISGYQPTLTSYQGIKKEFLLFFEKHI